MKTPWVFARYLRLAQSFVSKGRLPTLLLAVARKIARREGRLGGLREDLRLLQALCLAWWRGEYRQVSRQALLASVAGLLYFLSPLDALPDWLLGVGFLDDVAVLAWVMRTWRGELDAFRSWRAEQSVERRASLERLPSDEELDADTPRH
ncbi:YkvA family protein [Azotobacter bryophylli]|uniref:YkvA family protein n=1 Tax=Azotobacter bryophylli TaxID=1986537 RepID=A0ABV7AZF0_9GAMM